MYLGEDRFGLQPVWEALIEVYYEFAKVCDKHGLRYYVTDGNALGAVRHGGFIPWDDDLDVSMPRPDYEKFLGIADRELPDNLKIVRWQNTPEYNMLFAKVQETRREYVEGIEKKSKRMLSNGIYIDVFPIDGFPTSKFDLVVGRMQFSLLKTMLRFQCDRFTHQTTKGKIVWLSGMFLTPFFPLLWGHDRILARMEKITRQIEYDKSPLTGRSWNDSGLLFYPPHPKEVWGKPTKQKFGDQLLPFPEDLRGFLEIRYGDYMKLPPEGCRRPAHQYSWRCPWWLGPTRHRKISYNDMCRSHVLFG